MKRFLLMAIMALVTLGVSANSVSFYSKKEPPRCPVCHMKHCKCYHCDGRCVKGPNHHACNPKPGKPGYVGKPNHPGQPHPGKPQPGHQQPQPGHQQPQPGKPLPPQPQPQQPNHGGHR